MMLLLLLFVPLVHGQVSTPRGLYTRRRYRVFANNASEPCPDGCREDTDLSSCIGVSGSNFWIDSVCYALPEDRTRRHKLDSSGTAVCSETMASVDACTADPLPLCDLTDTVVPNEVGICTESAVFHDYYPAFCIAATEPEGEYIVPMASLFVYDDEAACRDTAVQQGTQFMIPVDPNLCLAEAITTKDLERAPGGTRAYCDEQGGLVYHVFLDRECTAQDDQTQFATSFVRQSTCQQDPVVQNTWTKADCNIQYYCKDLDGTPTGVRSQWTEPPSLAPSSSPSEEQSSANRHFLHLSIIVIIGIYLSCL